MSIYDCVHSALAYSEDIKQACYERDSYLMREYGDRLGTILRQALSELPPAPRPIPLGAPVAVELVPDDAKVLYAAYQWLLPQQPEVAERLLRLIMRMIDTHPSLHPECPQ